MKVAVELDCTPQEFREIFGLPDVAPMQQEWLEKTREAMIGDPQNFAPNKLIENWINASGGGLDLMPEMFKSFVQGTKDKSS